MGVSWRLKSYLARKHQIYTVSELQRRIAKKTGVTISVMNLCKYVNREPKRVSLRTVELICTALKCNLSDFLTVKPQVLMGHPTPRQLCAQTTPRSKIGLKGFPEPAKYEDR